MKELHRLLQVHTWESLFPSDRFIARAIKIDRMTVHFYDTFRTGAVPGGGGRGRCAPLFFAKYFLKSLSIDLNLHPFFSSWIYHYHRPYDQRIRVGIRSLHNDVDLILLHRPKINK